MTPRIYKAHFDYYDKKKKELTKRLPAACWASVRSVMNETEEIYIQGFENETTKKYIPRLIQLINRITPTEIVELKERPGEKFIKFKLLKTYDQNLFLLNFIRYLWDGAQPKFDQLKFFEGLNTIKSKDSLSLLMQANKEACQEGATKDHSNYVSPARAKIKTKKQLYEYKGAAISEFLEQ